jgi:hypothetical protein
MWVIIYIYMEMSHGNDLYIYIKHRKISFKKISENRREEQFLSKGIGTSRRGMRRGKGVGGCI